MLAALARQLERAALAAGRRPAAAYERRFVRELTEPDMQTATSELSDFLRYAPDIEHLVTVREREPLARARGHMTGVSLQPRQSDAGPQVLALHNHPRLRWPEARRVQAGDEAPLSMSDIGFAAAYEGAHGARGFGGIAALTSDGNVLNPRGSTARFTSRGRKHLQRALLQRLLDVLRKDISNQNGRINPHIEAINRAMDRTGLIRYGSRYAPENEIEMQRQAPYMEMIENEAVRSLFHPAVFGLPYPFRWSHIAGGAAAAGGAGAGVALGARERRRGRR
jgi:hypothetical protein